MFSIVIDVGVDEVYVFHHELQDITLRYYFKNPLYPGLFFESEIDTQLKIGVRQYGNTTLTILKNEFLHYSGPYYDI